MYVLFIKSIFPLCKIKVLFLRNKNLNFAQFKILVVALLLLLDDLHKVTSILAFLWILSWQIHPKICHVFLFVKYNPYIRNHKSLLGNVCIVLLLLWYKKAMQVRNISKRYCHDDASWRVWVLVFCSRYNTILKCEWRMGKSEKNNISSDQVATQLTFI